MPSRSVALAVITTGCGETIRALSSGVSSDTTGATLGTTVTVRAADVVVAPLLSLATAFSV
jgi:hypothetical protein